MSLRDLWCPIVASHLGLTQYPGIFNALSFGKWVDREQLIAFAVSF
jgi:hypothetical protein